MARLSLKDGAFFVSLARKAVAHYFETGKKLAVGGGMEKRGVFVSLHSFPENRLRGCIGFPQPAMPLDEAVVEAALAAAFGDYRFEPLGKGDLGKVIFEISVLSVPKELKVEAKKRAEEVKIGRDGLTIEHNGRAGLLLPQVAVEEEWSPNDFLTHACFKAGLHESAWMDEAAKVCTVQAQVFCEKAPGGVVQEDEF